MDDVERAVYWKNKALKCKTQRDSAREDRNVSTSHAVLSGRAIVDLQRKANMKKSSHKSKAANVVIGGRVVTSQEGREEALRQKAAREDKEAKAKQMQQRKDDAEFEQRTRREREGREHMRFAGALTGQRRPVLGDLAWSLQLDESGTREDLIGRIKTYFESHPELQNDMRYQDVFRRPSKRRIQPVDAPADFVEDTLAEASPTPSTPLHEDTTLAPVPSAGHPSNLQVIQWHAEALDSTDSLRPSQRRRLDSEDSEPSRL